MVNGKTWRDAAQYRGWQTACAALACAMALAGCAALGGGSSPAAPVAAAAPPPAAVAAPPSSAAAAVPPTAAASTPPPAAAAATAPSAASSDSSFTGRVKSLFAGPSYDLTFGATPRAPVTPPSSQVNCPFVDYRQGAATLTINAPNADNPALGLRYQGSLVQTARECFLHGNALTIKVGIEGRIVVGPAGGPGSVTVPLRYALVREGLEPKTIWTKLFLVPVAIPEGQLNVPFVHVEEEMTVPMPPSAELDTYVIYIGFDPEGAAPPPAKPKPAKSKTARSRSTQ
jgi:hypothetical protein